MKLFGYTFARTSQLNQDIEEARTKGSMEMFDKMFDLLKNKDKVYIEPVTISAPRDQQVEISNCAFLIGKDPALRVEFPE